MISKHIKGCMCFGTLAVMLVKKTGSELVTIFFFFFIRMTASTLLNLMYLDLVLQSCFTVILVKTKQKKMASQLVITKKRLLQIRAHVLSKMCKYLHSFSKFKVTYHLRRF